VQLVESSLENDMTIYDTPKEFTYTFDREIEAAEGVLRRSDGDKAVIAVALSTKGAVLTVTPEAPLERDAAYALQLDQVAGIDGASLAKPLKTAFTLSGGPKVASVSVGSSNVAQNATITVTFDQPLKEDIAIEEFARSTGVGASVAVISKNSITFTLSSASLCSAFSLVIDKGLPSGSNDALSTKAWKFDSRISCGYSSVIGYSVNGRAIISYTFGTGASTLLFTGGMHGSEPSGTSTMQAWADYLQSYGYQIPADKKVVIVPNTNPDGIATGARYNANNVNIDRNFPSANWRSDIDTATGLLPTGGGASAGSEPETKALIALTRQLRPRLEVSFHAQGSLLGANQLGDSVAIANAYGATVGYGSMIGNAEEVMGYSITGEYEDWMGEEMGVPAILIELPTQYGNYLSSQLTALLNLLKA
jgi:protein MpaA